MIEQFRPGLLGGRDGGGLRNRLQKTTATLAIVAALASGCARDNSNNSVEIFTPVTSMSFVVEGVNGSTTNLNFVDLRNSPSPGKDAIRPNATIQNIIYSPDAPNSELNIMSLRIQDLESFTNWVNNQSQRQEVIDAAGIQNINQLTAEDLVKLSAATVIVNKQYMYPNGTSEKEKAEKVEAVYELPIDVILMGNSKIQCDGYAVGTVAVFNELKKTYPEILKNTYLIVYTGIGEGHVWNAVINMQSPSEASLSFLDPTANDPDYKEGKDIKINVVELLEGLY